MLGLTKLPPKMGPSRLLCGRPVAKIQHGPGHRPSSHPWTEPLLSSHFTQGKTESPKRAKDLLSVLQLVSGEAGPACSLGSGCTESGEASRLKCKAGSRSQHPPGRGLPSVNRGQDSSHRLVYSR